ncbi:hypothetical protein [Variovorax sp. HJSM1_2]
MMGSHGHSALGNMVMGHGIRCDVGDGTL